MNLSIKEIIKQYESGIMQSEIAKKYGVTPTCISRKIKRYYQSLGVENPRATSRSKDKIKLPKEEIMSKYEEGISLLNLANEYGVSDTTMLERIREYYKGKIPRKINSATLIVEYLKKGLTIEEILETASKKGLIIPQDTIDRALKRMEEEELKQDNEER